MDSKDQSLSWNRVVTPRTQATTTLISNKYVAYTWLLFFTLTSDTTSVIVRWGPWWSQEAVIQECLWMKYARGWLLLRCIVLCGQKSTRGTEGVKRWWTKDLENNGEALHLPHTLLETWVNRTHSTYYQSPTLYNAQFNLCRLCLCLRWSFLV